ncbi:MAG TPA: basic amino acid ABC transporter substrate-binding protein [Rectinemataceae bacterium]|nr:basic amino acid ABC transporter substrate-binding protein [Rectinemataceae bacterium]
MKIGRVAVSLALLALLTMPGFSQDRPKFVFGSDATFPPMEFINQDTKQVVGFDVDMINAIGKVAGFDAVVKSTAWDGIFAGLAAGDYDGVLSSVTITDDRKKVMDFSTPYLNAGQVIIVRKSTNNITKPEDLAGKVVGVQISTTGDIAVAKIPGVKEKKTYDDIGLAIEDLAIGRIDAAVVDSPTAAGYVLQNDKYKATLKISSLPFTEEYYGIAVKKGDTRLLGLINKGLDVIMKDGTLDALKKKWLQ